MLVWKNDSSWRFCVDHYNLAANPNPNCRCRNPDGLDSDFSTGYSLLQGDQLIKNEKKTLKQAFKQLFFNML